MNGGYGFAGLQGNFLTYTESSAYYGHMFEQIMLHLVDDHPTMESRSLRVESSRSYMSCLL